jgi:hypothetical protein
MSESSVQASRPVATGTGSFRLYRHVVFGLAIALIAPFTALAWPFAIVLGIVIGQDDVDRRRQIQRSAATTILRVLAVTGGILAMLFVGAIVGGLIALPIVALSVLSERAAADAEPADRIVARLIILILPILAYVALLALGVSISIRVGA